MQPIVNKQKVLIVALVAMMAFFGCARKRTGSSLPEPIPTTVPVARDGVVPDIPDTTDPLNPGANVWSSGGSAAFIPVSNSVFDTWVNGHPVEPQNALINVSLTPASGKGTYYGTVKIRYQHSGVTYEATLKSGSETYGGNDYYKYNYWYNNGEKKVFSAFFEDRVGAIVLIIDQYIDLGDGGGATMVGGEVWFKNFTGSWANYDEGAGWADAVLPCWFRTIGPYDCRSHSIINKTSLVPSEGYQKLGRFSNMDKLKAFGN